MSETPTIAPQMIGLYDESDELEDGAELGCGVAGIGRGGCGAGRGVGGTGLGPVGGRAIEPEAGRGSGPVGVAPVSGARAIG